MRQGFSPLLKTRRRAIGETERVGFEYSKHKLALKNHVFYHDAVSDDVFL